MKKIDLEAHFLTEGYLGYLSSRRAPPRREPSARGYRIWYAPELWSFHSPASDGKLLDLGAGRIAEMDAAGIDVQVLSLSTPGCEQFEAAEATRLTRGINERLSRAVGSRPDRFVGLAALAPQDPDAAARELERAVKELGLRGAKINSNIRGEYLDDRKYWPVFETAHGLGVPIYLHPTIPSPSMLKAYSGYGFALAGPALGFGAEAALHALRLIYSGLFDSYPRLKIILGHLGEALPFWLHRIDYPWINPWADPKTLPKIEKRPSDYLRANLVITTSGMSYFPAFQCCALALGADHVVFASDYPYENSRLAAEFVEKLPVPEADREKIFHSTAESLLR